MFGQTGSLLVSEGSVLQFSGRGRKVPASSDFLGVSALGYFQLPTCCPRMQMWSDANSQLSCASAGQLWHVAEVFLWHFFHYFHYHPIQSFECLM